ncbi:MAG: CAP domain-containing protein [Syntrophobacteraceae bacterium]
MRKTVILLLMLFFWAAVTPVLARAPLPPSPRNRSVQPDSAEVDKAEKLYFLLRRENRRLNWDRCLAGKAFLRARQMVKQGYFDHEDPRTGKNPAWLLVQRCFSCRSAGENLAKGMDTPENIHKALMKSPTHRKNIVDRRFSRVGVGCYDHICVELFAGL